MITVVHGKQTEALTRAELDARAAACAGVTVDLGAGDGAWSYRYAQAHPDRVVVAIDPVRENLREYSARAAGKPERGGLPNVLYAVASVEHLPEDLRAIAGDVYITLPWGSLMRGLILADQQVLDGVAALARPGGTIHIVLNTRIFEDPIPLEARDLPDLTPEYVRDHLTEPYARSALHIEQIRELAADEVAALGTTWAKRLSHRPPPPSLLIKARRATHTRVEPRSPSPPVGEGAGG
jgi:16S rRNA (adenine(1408)-N(1))-methyltransferase